MLLLSKKLWKIPLPLVPGAAWPDSTTVRNVVEASPTANAVVLLNRRNEDATKTKKNFKMCRFISGALRMRDCLQNRGDA